FSLRFILASISIFFFSSRRRHTVFSRDWSSDVCSSDLLARLALSHARILPNGVQSPRPNAKSHVMTELEPDAIDTRSLAEAMARSEERRVGKEILSRWSVLASTQKAITMRARNVLFSRT